MNQVESWGLDCKWFQLWHRRIEEAAKGAIFPEKMHNVFALAHFAWAKEAGFEEQRTMTVANNSHLRFGSSGWFYSEVSRLKFDLKVAWRVSPANKDHK